MAFGREKSTTHSVAVMMSNFGRQVRKYVIKEFAHQDGLKKVHATHSCLLLYGLGPDGYQRLNLVITDDCSCFVIIHVHLQKINASHCHFYKRYIYIYMYIYYMSYGMSMGSNRNFDLCV